MGSRSRSTLFSYNKYQTVCRKTVLRYIGKNSYPKSKSAELFRGRLRLSALCSKTKGTLLISSAGFIRWIIGRHESGTSLYDSRDKEAGAILFDGSGRFCNTYSIGPFRHLNGACGQHNMLLKISGERRTYEPDSVG